MTIDLRRLAREIAGKRAQASDRGRAEGFERGPLGALRLPGAEDPLVSGLSDAVVVTDDTGSVLYANPALTELLGWDAGEIAGHHIALLLPERLRGAELVGGRSPDSAPALADLGGPSVRVPALHRDGREVPVELGLSRLQLEDRHPLVVALLRDSRQHEEAERSGQLARELLDLASREAPDDETPFVNRLLEVLAGRLGWDAALLWSAGNGMLRLRGEWGLGAGPGGRMRGSETMPIGPSGGLAASVAAGGEPQWRVELSNDPRLSPAGPDAEYDPPFVSGCGIPVGGDHGVVGVVELFARRRRPVDLAAIEGLGQLGTEVAEVLRRWEIDRDRRELLAVLESNRRSQAFLLEASRVLAAAGSYRQTLERLAEVAVPHLGDLCLIDIVDERGGLRRMAAAHADPARRSLAEELRRHPPDARGAHPSAEVARTGRSRWSPTMDEAFLQATTRDAQHLELTRELGFTSYLCVPLITPDKVLGSVTLVSTGSGRRFAPEDLVLAEELASQVAAVVDTARANELQHEVNHLLQRNLLPERLDVVPGLDAASRYLSSNEATEVGGDFYDLIPLGPDRVALVVGDVQGHDMVATSLMGQLRNALRAYALEDQEPETVLSRLDEFVEAFHSRMATVCYGVLETESGRFRVATAGHPAPLIVTPDGPPHLLPVGPGPPVGVVFDRRPVRRPTAECKLEVSDLALLYTDGLVEHRHLGIGEGLHLLTEAVAAVGALPPDELCSAIVTRLVGAHGPADDVAILAVQRTAGPSDGGFPSLAG